MRKKSTRLEIWALSLFTFSLRSLAWKHGIRLLLVELVRKVEELGTPI